MFNQEFAAYIDDLAALTERLRSSQALSHAEVKAVRGSGVYCFSEAGKVLYLGRTKNFSKRHNNHCGTASGENTAAFAFLLARESTGKMKASYKKEGSRKHLIQDPAFYLAFMEAKERIRSMEVRFISVPDGPLQLLLELYASLELGLSTTNL